MTRKYKLYMPINNLHISFYSFTKNKKTISIMHKKNTSSHYIITNLSFVLITFQISNPENFNTKNKNRQNQRSENHPHKTK